MTIPNEPFSRKEQYLAKMAGQDVSIPAEPFSREEQYLEAIDSHLDAKADLVDGKIPASELPSYVDDVVEGYYHDSKFYEDDQYTEEITPESSKIYIDLATGYTYRWGGTEYVQIGGGGDVPVLKKLTNNDLNYPESSPNRVALCDLPDGFYYRDKYMSKAVCASHATTIAEQLASVPMEYAVVAHEDDDNVSIYMYGVYGDRAVRVYKGTTQNFYQRPKEVVDDLTSTDAKSALSAKQGKALDEKVDKAHTIANSAPTTSTVGALGQLYTDTTGMHTYQCTAISGDTYTWTQRW